MTNEFLIINWRDIAIRFKISKEISSLSGLFFGCLGESEIDVGGKKEKVVTFLQGGDVGSPAIFFTSDDNDKCWTYAHSNGTHVKSNIGSFMAGMPKATKKKNRKKKLTSTKDDV